MRHQLHPSIDGLENKTLLSHLAVGLMAHHPALQAEVQRAEPMGQVVDHRLAHHAVVQSGAQPADTTNQSGMTVSLTTNQTTYNPGQVCAMTLTMTNTPDKDETVDLGPSIDGFIMTQNGNVFWQSNAGPQPTYIVYQTLKPAQSITLTVDWRLPASANGTYVVYNQLFPSVTATFNVTTPGQQ